MCSTCKYEYLRATDEYSPTVVPELSRLHRDKPQSRKPIDRYFLTSLSSLPLSLSQNDEATADSQMMSWPKSPAGLRGSKWYDIVPTLSAMERR